MFDLRAICFAYGVGSFGGAFTVLGFWLLATSNSYWASLLMNLDVNDFYEPMVLGGLWGLVYLIPSVIPVFWKGILYSFCPAVTAMALKLGWFGPDFLAVFDPGILVRQDALMTFLVYACCWGLPTAYIINRT